MIQNHIDMKKKRNPQTAENQKQKRKNGNLNTIIKPCKIAITTAEFKQVLKARKFWAVRTSRRRTFQTWATRTEKRLRHPLDLQNLTSGQEIANNMGYAINQARPEIQNHRCRKQFYTTDKVQASLSSSQYSPDPGIAAFAYKEQQNYKTKEFDA